MLASPGPRSGPGARVGLHEKAVNSGMSIESRARHDSARPDAGGGGIRPRGVARARCFRSAPEARDVAIVHGSIPEGSPVARFGPRRGQARMNPAPNLVLVGPMGAGKSSIGRRLSERLGMHFVDADVAIEAATGASIPLIFEMEGEDGFRARERTVLAELCAHPDQVIATGGGAVLDPENRRVLAASGYVVYLRTGIERQLERLERDRHRPLLRAPDRRARLEALAAPRNPLYEDVADMVYDSDHASVASAVDALCLQLATRWRRSGTGCPA
jgi:shikimate kinase